MCHCHKQRGKRGQIREFQWRREDISEGCGALGAQRSMRLNGIGSKNICWRYTVMDRVYKTTK